MDDNIDDIIPVLPDMQPSGILYYLDYVDKDAILLERAYWNVKLNIGCY